MFALAKEHITSVSIVSHPSLLQVPADIEQYRDLATAPLLINSCEVDQQFPIEKQKGTDELLGDGKFKPGYKRTYWDGCEHGFAVSTICSRICCALSLNLLLHLGLGSRRYGELSFTFKWIKINV